MQLKNIYKEQKQQDEASNSLPEEGKEEVARACWKREKSSSAGKDCFESLAQPFTSYMIWGNLIYMSGLLCKSTLESYSEDQK